MGVIGRAADQVGLGLDGGDAGGVDPVDEALDLAHHLRSDAVARKQQEFVGSHESISALC